MNWLKDPEATTFQLTVSQLTVLTPLPKEHIHVTICIGDMSKITCSGRLAQNGLRVQWNHPFLFFASPTTPVQIAIWILPKELSLEWDKQPLGDQIVTDVASLLKSGNAWRCDVPGHSIGPATLYITCKATDVLLVPYGHDCLSALGKYKTKLYSFGRSSKNVASMSTKIEVELARLDLCPLGHPDHIGILNDLGIAYSFCYDQDGNLADLYRAIEVHQITLDLCPLGHPNHANALGGLAMVLGMHYHIQRNKKDLNRLIGMKEKWLELCPLGHSNHAKALGSLAISLRDRYLAEGNVQDLQKALEMEENWLKLCPIGHPDHGIALANLALSLNSHYQKLGDLVDLGRNIELQEKHLELCPPGHLNHGLALQNLAISLLDHYHKTNDHSNLGKANRLFKKALETYPAHHRYFAFNTSQIAATILLLSSPPDQPLSLPDEAFEAYRLLKKCGPTPSLDFLQATQAWVKDAEKYNHSSVLEAYQTLLETLDHFTSLSSSLTSRHETMQARMTDIISDAFSCAIRHGNFQMAVEFLEQGRGILWNQLARLDVSMAMLENRGDRDKELGRKFTRLSAELRKYAEGSVGQGASPYWRVREEWQRVVDKIRGLDGFSRFLLPPSFDDLRHAAEGGPVIIVNASPYSCDALIVLYTMSPIHVPLPCSYKDVVQLCSQLSELTGDIHRYGVHREFYMKEILRDLWNSVVEPIAFVLQDDIHLPLGSRIWWCPTSKFTTLPLHAAGPFRRSQKGFIDLYVSSYASSLSGLIRTRDRIRSQTETRGISRIPNVITFSAIGQAHPSADLELHELPEVEHEIHRIRNETGMPAEVHFEAVTGPAATIESVVQAFRDHRWVHVACHGISHATNPFDSWLATSDGRLTLMRIIQERYTNSDFAFLSAAHTATGNVSTPDVLHLAAGMQFAGFNGVIGALWRVDDAVSLRVVTRFYKEMFKHPNIDFQHAAAALNAAVIETADEVSLEKRIVFVHFGI